MFGRLESGGQKSGRDPKSLSSRATLLPDSGVAPLGSGLGFGDFATLIAGRFSGRVPLTPPPWPFFAGAIVGYRFIPPCFSILSSFNCAYSLRAHRFLSALYASATRDLNSSASSYSIRRGGETSLNALDSLAARCSSTTR